MKKLHELKEKLCDQLKGYNDKELTSATLDVVDKLAHTIKNLDKIIEKYEEQEYSNTYGGSYRMMPHMGTYDITANGSFARGRGARRDSMGRYSGGYYDDGYSRHGDMIGELTELMETAPDERTRMEFQKFIQKMQMM